MASDAVLHHPQLVAAILESLGCENALARACAVSLFWKQEASANSLWRPLCLRRFPQLAGLLAPTADFQKLFAGQARAQSRPFRTPAMPALPHVTTLPCKSSNVRSKVAPSRDVLISA